MAIGIQTFTKASGYTRSDVIDQLEDAIAFAGFHGEAVTGIVTGINAYAGGGTDSTPETISAYEVIPSVSSRAVGIASTCSFRVERNSSGNVTKVHVNAPGSGYQDGDTFTLPSAQFTNSGGSDITLSVNVDETVYGSTSTFYKKSNDVGVTNPFGVMKMVTEANKLYGDSYYAMQVQDDNYANFFVGSKFMPYESDKSVTTDKLSGGKNSFRGMAGLDVDTGSNTVYDVGFDPGNTSYADNKLNGTFRYSSGDNTKDLHLTCYKSGIDPNFVVFVYSQPSINTTVYAERNFGCWFFHNFVSSVYDYDYVFNGGFTHIMPEGYSGSSINPRILFNTRVPIRSSAPARRAALYGYCGHASQTNADNEFDDAYLSMTYESSKTDNYFGGKTTYYRNTAQGHSAQARFAFGNPTLNSSANFNAVVKGLPLSAVMVPVPYYLPDDFVMISFELSTPNVLVDQGDTFTISGSEVYTVISASYADQESTTRGIAFCGRFV